MADFGMLTYDNSGRLTFDSRKYTWFEAAVRTVSRSTSTQYFSYPDIEYSGGCLIAPVNVGIELTVADAFPGAAWVSKAPLVQPSSAEFKPYGAYRNLIVGPYKDAGESDASYVSARIHIILNGRTT